MLKVQNIKLVYGDMVIIDDISFDVPRGTLVSIIAANGSGKSTILKAISGLIKTASGEIYFEGKRIDREATENIVDVGIAHVPEGRRLFSRLTVLENLYLGYYTRRKSRELRKKKLEMVFDLFPIIAERKNQLAGTFSGGQQQMLAIARGMMSSPKLLMLDEPSLGLSPIMVSEIFETIKNIQREGVTILLVEQNVVESLELCDWAYVLQTGKVTTQGSGEYLLSSDVVRKSYLGI